MAIYIKNNDDKDFIKLHDQVHMIIDKGSRFPKDLRFIACRISSSLMGHYIETSLKDTIKNRSGGSYTFDPEEMHKEIEQAIKPYM